MQFMSSATNHCVSVYSDSPLDLKIKGNMMCDLFALTGKTLAPQNKRTKEFNQKKS